MKEWQQRKFGELYKVPSRNGVSKPSRVRGSGYKMINMGELFANDRIYDIDMELVPLTDNEKEKAKVESGDLLFARQSLVASGAGKCSIVMKTSELTVFESHLIRVRLDQEIADPMFYYYYFKSPRSPMRTIIEHCVQAGIKASDLEKLLVKVPPIEEQRKTARVLSRIDKKIEVNKEINENLLQQAQALYNHSFPYTVSDILPEDWRLGTVSEIIEIHDSKRIPLSGAQRDKMEKKIYPYYGAASLMDYVDEYIFDGKYLLLGEDGTVIDDAGFPILQYVWGQFWVNNHAHILTGKLGYNVESLYMLFKQTPVKSIVTGAVQPKISQANLKSIPVVIPPANLIRAFNNQVNEMFTLIRNIEEENKSLATLRDSLLPKLMSGEIDLSALDL